MCKLNSDKKGGVTIVELLVVLTIIGVLSQLVIGSYSKLVTRTRIYIATSELHASLLYARSEAIKHGGSVIICRSSNADSVTPSCDSDMSDDNLNSGWGAGWIIYKDRDHDGKLSTEDTILRVRGKLFSSSDQGSIIPSPKRKQIKFNEFGQVYGTFLQFKISQAKSPESIADAKYICIASGGRARVDKIACSAK